MVWKETTCKRVVKYCQREKVISESVRPTGWVMVATELQHAGQIGSSVRPREVWDVRRWLNGCDNRNGMNETKKAKLERKGCL